MLDSSAASLPEQTESLQQESLPEQAESLPAESLLQQPEPELEELESSQEQEELETLVLPDLLMAAELDLDENPIRYAGEYYDHESGYTYLRARYYDPEIGRFVSQDPAKDGYNWYVYCESNPLMYVDPSGLLLETVLDIGGLIWSAYDMYKDPSWLNAGFLLWDVAAILIPVLPGSYTGKGLKAASKIDDAIDVVNAVNKFDNVADVARGLNRADDAADAIRAFNRADDAADALKGINAAQNGVGGFTNKFQSWLNRGAANNTVYYGMKGGDAVYTGITMQDINRRLYQHNNPGKGLVGKGFSYLDPKHIGLTRNQARAIEQFLIENGPANALNRINSISPKSSYYKEAMEWAMQFLENL